MAQRRMKGSIMLVVSRLLLAGGCVRERVVERDTGSGGSAPAGEAQSSGDRGKEGGSSPTKALGKVVATGTRPMATTPPCASTSTS